MVTVITGVTHVTVLVGDVDEAIEWYTDALGLELRADEEFAPGARWVTVAPADGDTEVVLQEPSEEFHGAEAAREMRERIGEGTMTVLAVDDCRATAADLADRGVEIRTGPEEVPWGVPTVVADPWGNPFDLVEAR